jgi:pimeloyl-ACP methyl ester carboxylesterase
MCERMLKGHRRLEIALAIHSIAAFVTILFFAGCAQYASVREKPQRVLPPSPGVAALQGAEQSISDGLRRAKNEPLVAIGHYLSAVRTAANQLERTPADATARRDYNFAIARVFTTIRDAELDPWTQPLRVPGDGGEFILTHQPNPRPEWRPSLYEFFPTDQLDLRGKYVTERMTQNGLGAPLVAVGRAARKDYREEFIGARRIYYGVTGVARFEGRRCVISFLDPLAKETVTLGGHTFPLAADYTAPLAVLLARENPKKFELTRLLRPQKYAETARIARLEPYHPEKITVLVVHGLADTPATWIPMLNALRGDPDIRRRYQFWFYSYPSGYPYPYSAAILRHELDAVFRRFPARKPIVLIGHSMGGMISRLMITDSNDKLWRTFFGKPPEQTALSPESREIVTQTLIFRHRAEVGRVIFIASPHRGSDLASNWIGRIGSSLVKAPITLLHIGDEIRDIVTLDTTALRLKRIPNSVDTLAPNNRFVREVNRIPITPGIPYHTIVGDRGRGDTPNSSDGVVPYWSSHLDGAQSELVVPSNHGAHQNPKAIAEVKRILLLNAGAGARARSARIANSR